MRRSFQFVLTIGVTWLIVAQIGVTQEEVLSLEGAMPQPTPGWMALSVLLLLGGFVTSAALWGRMVGELGGTMLGIVPATRIFLAANLGRYVPGKLWQMAGLAVLSRREGVPATVGAMAGALGQTFSLAAAGVLALPVIVPAGREVGGAAVTVLVALAALTLAISLPAVLRAGIGATFRIARLPLRELRSTGPWFGPRWVTLYLLNWIVYGAAFVLFLRGLGIPGGFFQLTGPFAAAYLLGYVAVFAPAGLGVREGFLIVFLRPDLGAAAVGVAVLTRVWMTVVELLPAGGVAIWQVYRTGRASPGEDGIEEEAR